MEATAIASSLLGAFWAKRPSPSCSSKGSEEEGCSIGEPPRTPEQGEEPRGRREAVTGAEVGDESDSEDEGPRGDYLGWEDYYMSMASLTALRSKDPRRRVGACLVTPGGVVAGLGYNGMPRGVKDSEVPWRRGKGLEGTGQSKHDFVCHAELNAVLNAGAPSLRGCRLYVTLFPCSECAKLLVQAGVSEVVYEPSPGKPPSSPAATTLSLAGVRSRPFSRSAACLSLAPLLP